MFYTKWDLGLKPYTFMPWTFSHLYLLLTPVLQRGTHHFNVLNVFFFQQKKHYTAFILVFHWPLQWPVVVWDPSRWGCQNQTNEICSGFGSFVNDYLSSTAGKKIARQEMCFGKQSLLQAKDTSSMYMYCTFLFQSVFWSVSSLNFIFLQITNEKRKK